MTEQFKGGTEQQEQALINFRAEIEAIKQEDMKRGTPIHLFDVNTEELTVEDMAMWNKIKDKSITLEDYNAYRPSFGSSLSQGQKEFRFFIANKAVPVISGKNLHELKENTEEKE